MTETCITWSQPDAKHFRGLCTNDFRLMTPPAGVKEASCNVCVTPVNPGQTCENSPATWICRNVDDGDTYVPFYKATITIPPAFRGGAPWYTGTTGTCDGFYIGDIYLYAFGGKCGRWTTDFAPLDADKYAKRVAFGVSCTDYTPEARADLIWAATNPVMTLTMPFRISSTTYFLNFTYTNFPKTALQHNCRDKIFFKTMQNTAGDYLGRTSARPMSDYAGASVSLEPYYP